jgi:formylglycine-generating enzyme required for sulfatase activity
MPDWASDRVRKKLASEPVALDLPEGVFYGKEPGVYWNMKDRSELVYVPGGDVPLGPWTSKQRGEAGDPTKESVVFETDRGNVPVAPFFIGRYEVSNEQFERFVKANPRAAADRTLRSIVHDGTGRGVEVDGASWRRPHGPGGPFDKKEWPHWPVTQVSYDDAQEYVAWAGLRLPDEAEWETAAAWTGEKMRVYPWGDTLIVGVAEILEVGFTGSKPHLARVDAYPEGRSPWGAFNMAGNAHEWVVDSRVDRHSVKGGAFYCGAINLRRDFRSTEDCSNSTGFRVAIAAR